MLTCLKGVGMRKRVALGGNLCLRGKMGRVGGRTLMVLSMVSPIVVLAHWDGLRSAPDNERGEKTAFVATIRTALTWALTYLCPASSSDGHVGASLGQGTELRKDYEV
jgi:hypothetical protein